MPTLTTLLLDLLYPKYCLNCIKPGQYICTSCLPLLTRHQQICLICNHTSRFGKTHPECLRHSYLDGIIIATKYEKLTKYLLYKVKHNHYTAILEELLPKTLLSPKIQQCLTVEQFTLISEVPMHKNKQRTIGFNQATIIANWIHKHYAIPYTPLLQKTKATTPQKYLSKHDRLFNLNNAFQPITPSQIINQSILLVDDITTSGATLQECTKVLKENGAQKVWGLVIASGK